MPTNSITATEQRIQISDFIIEFLKQLFNKIIISVLLRLTDIISALDLRS